METNITTATPVENLRNALADVVGYPHLKSQMDTFMTRLEEKQGELLKKKTIEISEPLRAAIVPHDDYMYVGYLYPLVFQKIEAKTVILFGVSHTASVFGLKDKLVFDSFTHWLGPYGKIKVSPLRDEIKKNLPEEAWIEHDIFQKVEHSVEAELPFLQFYNRDVEIISILETSMTFDRMKETAKLLSTTLEKLMKEKGLKWGKDIAVVISNDCVHYGDQGWGGRQLDPFGADEKGKQQAVEFDLKIIKECLEGELSEEKLQKFTEYTTDKETLKGKWMWCGRMSVPFGLLVSLYLQDGLKEKPLEGVLLDYATSIDKEPIPVSDLNGMGTTSPANLHHWVGYTSIAFI